MYKYIGAIANRSRFGHFSETPGVGTKDKWIEFIDDLFISRLNIIHKDGVWDDAFYNRSVSLIAFRSNDW